MYCGKIADWSVGKQDNGTIPDMKSRVESGVHLNSVNFDCGAVMKATSKLQPNLAVCVYLLYLT